MLCLYLPSSCAKLQKRKSMCGIGFLPAVVFLCRSCRSICVATTSAQRRRCTSWQRWSTGWSLRRINPTSTIFPRSWRSSSPRTRSDICPPTTGSGWARADLKMVKNWMSGCRNGLRLMMTMFKNNFLFSLLPQMQNQNIRFGFNPRVFIHS